MKKMYLAVIFVILIFPQSVNAAKSNYITPIFPVRAREYWRQTKDISEITNITEILKKYDLPSTWILHYDVIDDNEILKNIPENSQLGLFLEVTRKLADESFVKFNWEEGNWSQSDKVFISGYELDERKRIINTAFEKFKNKFGYYPKFYGAWYVDVWSMEYIKNVYGADILLGLADQYSTDGYQEWGQYLNLPYYVSKKSAIEPAQNNDDSTNILKIQWAPRHPALGMGADYSSSNYSAQVNDYARSKKLSLEYFRDLANDTLLNVNGDISQIVVGIEIGELEKQYFPELEKQMHYIKTLNDRNIAKIQLVSEFNSTYRAKFKLVSPEATIVSNTGKSQTVWYMNPNLRYGYELTEGKLVLFDLRFYHYSQLRDNDQLIPDKRKNLVRVVPAVIDWITYKNEILINSPDDIYSKIKQPEKINYPNEIGEYEGNFPHIKATIVRLFRYLPDVRYSVLDGNYYFGIRTGFTKLIGFSFPNFKIGSFDFPFSTLENFISLKNKFKPNFKWIGKQEVEVKKNFIQGKIIEKGLTYGQENLSNLGTKKVLFENSYYLITKE